MKLLLVFTALFLNLVTATSVWSAQFNLQERELIQSLSGHHLHIQKDPSNRASGNALAIKTGKALFYDTRLSPDNLFSCASCHQPDKGWSDGRAISQIQSAPPAMHTPTLWNAAANRWFFWDGRADTLWNQATHTIESPKELNSNRVHIARLVLQDKFLRQTYRELFGAIPKCVSLQNLPSSGSPSHENIKLLHNWIGLSACEKKAVNQLFTSVTKMIAAFEETITSRNAPFDKFAKELKNKETSSILSEQAQQGLKLFLGQARCVACHSGPNFSDSEFHSIFFERQKQDGRYTAIPKLLSDPFNIRGIHSDLPKQVFSKLDYVYRNIELKKKYKTPTLRNITQSAPYMHDGAMPDLKSVMKYYSELPATVDRTKHDELILVTIGINQQHQQALIAFMESLTETVDLAKYKVSQP